MMRRIWRREYSPLPTRSRRLPRSPFMIKYSHPNCTIHTSPLSTPHFYISIAGSNCYQRVIPRSGRRLRPFSTTFRPSNHSLLPMPSSCGLFLAPVVRPMIFKNVRLSKQGWRICRQWAWGTLLEQGTLLLVIGSQAHPRAGTSTLHSLGWN